MQLQFRFWLQFAVSMQWHWPVPAREDEQSPCRIYAHKAPQNSMPAANPELGRSVRVQVGLEMALAVSCSVRQLALRSQSTARPVPAFPVRSGQLVETDGVLSKEYIGSVVPNFWGTLFTLYDSGADAEPASFSKGV